MTLTHNVTPAEPDKDSGYVNLSAASTVIVTDNDMPPRLRAGDDTTINGNRVTVTAPAGEATPDVTVVPSSDLNGDIEVKIEPAAEPRGEVEALDATEGTESVRRRFSLGTDSADRTVVDITLTPPGSSTPFTDEQVAALIGEGVMTICLPVEPELRAEASRLNRPLQLLHFKDGAWTVVQDTYEEGATLCGRVTDFSRFAVGYQDAKPAFAADAKDVGPFIFLTGRAVDEALPAVTAGDGDGTREWDKDLPDGLESTIATIREDGERRYVVTITGKPTMPTALDDYTLTVKDVDGDEAELTIRIEVKPGIESRDLGLVLAGIGRTLATDAVEVLGGSLRLLPGVPPASDLGRPSPPPHPAGGISASRSLFSASLSPCGRGPG